MDQLQDLVTSDIKAESDNELKDEEGREGGGGEGLWEMFYKFLQSTKFKYRWNDNTLGSDNESLWIVVEHVILCFE
ncbi:hypothetical protein J6590_062130 [Homalodisca vitripennis]|nr:hypothetical protein J6590_062130 [Homalodisca vitripennis]